MRVGRPTGARRAMPACRRRSTGRVRPNLDHATLLYPTPHRLTLLGIQTFGYKNDVVFPVDAALASKGKPLDLKLELDILVCANLCIPKSFNLALSVPTGAATPDAEAQTIAKARQAVPGTARASGLEVKSVEEVSDKGAPGAAGKGDGGDAVPGARRHR